jgi:hypothetical protein
VRLDLPRARKRHTRARGVDWRQGRAGSNSVSTEGRCAPLRKRGRHRSDMLSNRRVERSGGAKWKAKRACRVLRVLGCRVEGFQRPISR